MRLCVEGLEKHFREKQVLKGAGFTFEKGNIYGLLGRNGAGKTTLFNCLSGRTPIDGGKIFLEDEKGARSLTAEEVGFVFTEPHLPDFLTGYEYLKFFCEINEGKIADPQPLETYFKQIQIAEEDQHRLIKGYSHGMKNKLQMLSFLILRPPVILLDEPLTSFDVVVALEIKNLLRSIRKDHIIIFSTHILQLAQDLCDDIVVLNGGKLEGMDQNMLHSPQFEEEIIQLLRDEEEKG